MKGYTFYTVVGSWGGFKFETNKYVPLRITLGFLSFGVLSVDIEKYIVYSTHAIQMLKNNN